MRLRKNVGTLIALIVFLIPLSVNAYTIVFRDGRRVTIPDNFVVGASTLTYEAAPTIQSTLQLSTIDIVATEKANNESVGALMRRRQTAQPPAVLQRTVSNRTVTNKDLDRYRAKRVASEVAYEKRRKELGLPSAQERSQEAQNISDRTHEELLAIQKQEREAESYWRSRAADLRAELAAVNARINFVQARLNELPLNYAFGGFANPSFISIGQLSRSPTLNSTLIVGGGFPGTLNPFGGPRSFPNRTFPARGNFNPFPRRVFNRGISPFGTVALPFDAYDATYERATLLNELDQLLGERAGFQARWRSLEDEARQAGAYPGWLR